MKEVKLARISKDMTQQQLADAVGVSIHTIRRIEQGTAKPSVNLLIKIADKLETTIAYLVGR